MSTFVAIDFETANHREDSACAVGVAAGRGGRIEVARSFLIRPPVSQFAFTGIHGLRWEDVSDAPTFGKLWPTLLVWIDNAEFIAAHNAPFDRTSSKRVAPRMVSGCRRCRSPVRSSLLVRNGEFTRRGCPMSAVGFASRCVTTTRGPTRKRVRASCLLPRPKDGGIADGHNNITQPDKAATTYQGSAQIGVGNTT